MDERELTDCLDGLEAQVIGLDDLKANLRVADEAVLPLKGMLTDLVRRLPEGSCSPEVGSLMTGPAAGPSGPA